jgi:hypothetical protein
MSHGRQPPVAYGLQATEQAASRWLNALVERSRCAANILQQRTVYAIPSHMATAPISKPLVKQRLYRAVAPCWTFFRKMW